LHGCGRERKLGIVDENAAQGFLGDVPGAFAEQDRRLNRSDRLVAGLLSVKELFGSLKMIERNGAGFGRCSPNRLVLCGLKPFGPEKAERNANLCQSRSDRCGLWA
jgi:hypothetical protein